MSAQPEKSDAPPAIERPLRFIEVPEHGDDAGEFEVEAGLIAKNEKTGQTNVQFKSL